MSDDPLEPMESQGCFHAVVVDLAGVRMRHGRSPAKSKPCEHKNLIISQSESRIWCEDCERTIEPFAALLTIFRQFEKMEREAQYKLDQATKALAVVARLRAVKELNRIWSGNIMAVACPHCKKGLLPEDFANGAAAAWARELEIATRRKVASNHTEDPRG